MIRNYLKIALRTLKRNAGYTILNTLGLALGVAACLHVFVVVRFEKSFDTFHTQASSTYRITTITKSQDGNNYIGAAAFPTGPALKLDFPQLKHVASIFRNSGQITVNQGTPTEKKLNERGFFYADTAFFAIFDFKWLAGDAGRSLKDPQQAVLTRATAEKYFGSWQAAVGKTITYENLDRYTVAGILENVPANTDFPLSIVVPFEALKRTPLASNLTDWVSTFGNAYTFVTLPPEMSAEQLDAGLREFAKKHKPVGYQNDTYASQRLAELHVDDRFGNFNRRTFGRPLMNGLMLIGLFLIGIACVNFVNLATAQAVTRSREVGVRKVLGGNRLQLGGQFISETLLIVTGAIVLGLVITVLTLPLINSLLGVAIKLTISRDLSLMAFLVALIAGITLLAGTYPAIILSGFNPIMALRNKISVPSKNGVNLRRSLVVLQFAIAQVLIICMLIVVSQLNLFKNTSLGFTKSSIVNLPLPGDSLSRNRAEFVKTQLAANKDIRNVSLNFGSPAASGNWTSDFKFDHSSRRSGFEANLKWADLEYFDTYDLQFVAGRPYVAGDTIREFVVNETLVRKLGIRDPEMALGKELDFWDGQKKGKIVGVVRDFNSYSLRDPVAPVVMGTWKDTYQTISLRIRPGAEATVMPAVEKLWKGTFPNYVYEYSFLDDTIADFYRSENRLSHLYKVFAAIAVFISCLGLYGMVSFMVVQRTREVGVRKVLGARVLDIVYLLSREFTLLILVAFAVGAPVAWLLMKEWLQGYTYRVSPGVFVFGTAIAGSLLLAWLTAGQQALRAALAKPVKSLRTE